MDENDSGYLDPKAVYFTVRKLYKGKWIAEQLQLVNDKLVRTRLSEPAGRAHAMEQFKIAVTKYWTRQYKGLL